ncbi:hypothetical protein BJX66DRAFT_341696 [Aspergillus keveii]|uniref:Uncharacterized protein n=1 Tax=Aspergillus keveii TaxID=714993 RepID=A0ABR4FUL0_9EURO
MAADEFWQAWKLTKRVDSLGFCMTHAFYALMGGFIITVPAEDEGETHPQGPTEAKGPTVTTESGHALQLSKPPQKLEYFSINSTSRSIFDDERERYELIDPVAVAVFKAITQETESALFFPRITEEDTKNQAKSDSLTKAFAVLQCTWLIVQSISRTSQGFLLTELELTTLAFTICAVIMYGFWWCKPFDAQRPIRLLCLDPQTVSQVHSRLEPWGIGSRILSTNMAFEYILGAADVVDEALTQPHVLARSAIFHTSGVAFSSIHLIAWNWDFPSPVIRILWRSFSLGATCLPLVTVAGLAPILFFGYKFDKSDGKDFVHWVTLIVLAAMGLQCRRLCMKPQVGIACFLTSHGFIFMPHSTFNSVTVGAFALGNIHIGSIRTL